jgi:hypothetical protein
MDRRGFLQTSTAGAVGAMTPGAAAAALAPNIVLIYAE